MSRTKQIERINIKQAIGYGFLPQQYSKQELHDKQVKLAGIMHYATATRNPDMLEAGYELALEYLWQEGYAQEPYQIGLEQVQNTHPSIVRVIEALRAEKNPTTGDTTVEEAEQLLFNAVKGGN